MVFNDDGSGDEGSKLKPFNEYMLVAWLAKFADDGTRAL